MAEDTGQLEVGVGDRPRRVRPGDQPGRDVIGELVPPQNWAGSAFLQYQVFAGLERYFERAS